MGCDCSGNQGFCMHHCQDAFDALEAIKERHGKGEAALAALGFYPESLLGAVGDIVHDVEAACERMRIPVDEAAQTLFVDGLLMGVLLAARAPKNHAEPAFLAWRERQGAD
jgi:hypothetical protein